MRVTQALVVIALLFASGCGASTTPAATADMVPGADLGPCNQIALPSMAVTVKAGMGAAPTAAGGAIVDGAYLLTSITDYSSPQSALVGRPTSGTRRFLQGTIESALMDAKGGVERFNTSYSVAGTNIMETGTCGDVQNSTNSYTATATTLTLIQSTPPIVSTFTRM